MSAPAERRSVPVPLLVGTQVAAYGRLVRSNTLREAADWLAEVGERNAAYLLRTCDVPRTGHDQDDDQKDTRGDNQSQGGESTAPDAVRPRTLPDDNTGQGQHRSRVAAFFVGVRCYGVARAVGTGAL